MAIPRLLPQVLLPIIAMGPVQVFSQRSGAGLRGGLLMSSMHSNTIAFDPVPGGTVGGFAALYIGPRIELQPELSFTMLGATMVEPDGDLVTTRLTYLQVPVLLKVFIIGNSVDLQVGLQPAKHLTAAQNGADVSDRYKGFDFGFLGGVGVETRFGWDVTLRYYAGHSPVMANDDTIFPKNRALMLTVGHRLSQFKWRAKARKRK